MTITIADVLSLVSNASKRNVVARIITNHEAFNTGNGSRGTHHDYPGGLKDHTFLVVLLSFHHHSRLPLFLKLSIDPDDVVIAALFHDFDKIGKYDDDPIYPNHSDVVEMLVDNGIDSKNVLDGILHSHGGWGSYKDEKHGLTSIIVHHADMIASVIMRDRDQTRESIAMTWNDLSR